MSKEAMSAFVKEKVTPRFDQALADAQRKLEAAQREIEDLKAAKGTLAWEVDGIGTVYINIADGKMSIADSAAEAPFLSIILSAADWQRLSTGSVPGGMMMGGRQQVLGQTRIQRIKGLKGMIRFLVTGLPDGGEMSTLLHFGTDARPAQPQTTIRMSAEVAQKLQNNELNPQMAFMQGQLKMEGDAGLAMQVGMAMM